MNDKAIEILRTPKFDLEKMNNATLVEYVNTLADFEEKLKTEYLTQVKNVKDSITENTSMFHIEKNKEYLLNLSNILDNQVVLIENKWLECITILQERAK